jgi:hypothetical protein
VDVKDFIKYYWGSYNEDTIMNGQTQNWWNKILRWNVWILWSDFAINYFDKEMILQVQV